jgi:putative SOS response-associated peptidase YedK
MCGRFELHSSPAAIALAFGLAQPPPVAPRYNIAPMQSVAIVRQSAAGERELVEVRWGLVPRWAKDPSIGARLINARAETIAERPTFHYAFHKHRCLVPADGFYEWRRTRSGREPVHVARIDDHPIGMAGVYERWLSREGDVLDTCTILTTHANALLRPVHDRMPVIVAPEHYARWLDTGDTDVADLLRPCPDDLLQVHPVSARVNAVRNDDAGLIEPVAAAPATSGRAQAEELKLPLQPRLL